MTKTNTKTAETIEFPSFDASKATDQFRAFADKGVEQSKEAYSKMKSGVEDSQKALEETFEQAKTFGDTFALKSIAAMRKATEANFSHLEALVGAKSLSEVMELQSSFVRKSVEMSVDHAKEFQTLSSNAASDVAKPMKSVFEKTMKEHKAA